MIKRVTELLDSKVNSERVDWETGLTVNGRRTIATARHDLFIVHKTCRLTLSTRRKSLSRNQFSSLSFPQVDDSVAITSYFAVARSGWNEAHNMPAKIESYKNGYMLAFL